MGTDYNQTINLPAVPISQPLPLRDLLGLLRLTHLKAQHYIRLQVRHFHLQVLSFHFPLPVLPLHLLPKPGQGMQRLPNSRRRWEQDRDWPLYAEHLPEKAD